MNCTIQKGLCFKEIKDKKKEKESQYINKLIKKAQTLREKKITIKQY